MKLKIANLQTSVLCAGVLEIVMPCSSAVQFHFQPSAGPDARARRAVVSRSSVYFCSVGNASAESRVDGSNSLEGSRSE